MPLLDAETVKSRYPRLRLQVFLGIFIGYAGYYLVRNNVPLVATLLRDEHGFNALGLGIITNGVLLAYGFSVANLFIGLVPGVANSIAFFAIIMIFNGFFQGMGWPPSGRTLVHWFSTSERGSKTALWNIAHSVGGAGSGAIRRAAGSESTAAGPA